MSDMNHDPVRESVEGIQYNARGNMQPTPFYCQHKADDVCKEDACYGRAGSWYCSKHWQLVFNSPEA